MAWKDKEGQTKHYIVGENGEFNIPKKTVMYNANPLTQLLIKQKLTVFFEDQEFDIWTLSKMEEAAFTELGGKPINLTCELTNDERTVRGNRSLGGTKCTWESLEEVKSGNERN